MQRTTGECILARSAAMCNRTSGACARGTPYRLVAAAGADSQNSTTVAMESGSATALVRSLANANQERFVSEVVTPHACRLSADLQQLQGRLQASGAEQQRAAGEAQQLLAANDRCMSVWHTPFLHATCELFIEAAGGDAWRMRTGASTANLR